MDIRSWGITQIVAATVVYWAALFLVTRTRSRRRVQRAMSGMDLAALEPGVLTPVEGVPDMAIRRTAEGLEMKFEGRTTLTGALLVLGPPVALALVRYVFPA